MSARRSPQSVPVTTQGGVGSRCQPAQAIAGAATATKHEPGMSPLHRVVSYGSATEVWPPDEIALSSSACTQRSIRCGAALASRLDPLTKLSSLLCSTEHLFQIQNPSVVHATQATGPADDITQRHPRKTSPLASAFPLALQLHHRSLPGCVAHDFCNPKNSVAFGHDSSFFAVTRQQWRTCVRRTLRCRPTCILAPSSLGPRLASTGSLETDAR